MDIREVLDCDLTRGYLLRSIVNNETSFFGNKTEKVITQTGKESLAHFGLHPRLSHSSVTGESDMVTCMALAYEYAAENESAKSIPNFVMKSALASEFKPDRKQLYEYAKQSETYRKLTSRYRDSKYYTRERIMDYAGTRRFIFAKALSGEFPEKYSVELCVFKKFLDKIGSPSLKEITKSLYNNCVERDGEYEFASITPMNHEHLFALPKSSKGFDDYGSVMPDIGCTIYNSVIDYVNSRKFDFVEALGVLDVLTCIMTISCTNIPIKLFPTFVEDRNIRNNYKKLMSSYFLTGFPFDDLDDKEKLEKMCMLNGGSLFNDPKHIAKIYGKLIRNSAKETLNDDYLVSMLRDGLDLQNSEMVEGGSFNLALCSQDAFYIHAYKQLTFQWMYFNNVRSNSVSVKISMPNEPFDPYVRFNASKIHHGLHEAAITVAGLNVMPFDVLLECLVLSIALRGKPFKSVDQYSKGVVKEYMHKGSGVVQECIDEIYAANPDLFSGKVTFKSKDFRLMTKALFNAYEKNKEIEGEDQDPDEIFAQMEAMKSAENFDIEAFSELAAKFARNRSDQGEFATKREEIYKEFLSEISALGTQEESGMTMVVVESTKEAPETVSETPDLSDYVARTEYDEALELMHQAETERDDYKKRAHEAETLREQAEKHAYSLERPAKCGEALIKFAKRGYIESVSHAVEIAEGLSEGKLRILPSAVESAAESTYNLPAKVKDALCLLADHYIEDLERGGVPEARKHHGRNFRGGESDTTSSQTKLMDQRTFMVDGEKRVFTTHLAFGTKAAKTNHIRIYFDVDMEARQVIVAYIGKHLDTSTKV